MRRAMTFLALACAMMWEGKGKHQIANNTRESANKSMGTNPMYVPSKSQRVKNKLNRLRKNG